MNVDESLKMFGMHPRVEQLPQIREILQREVQLEKSGLRDEEDLAYLCCIQLFVAGHLADIFLIWEAKLAGMDLGTMIDMQLLCGPGIEQVKRYLTEITHPSAADILHAILDAEAHGELDAFSKERAVSDYRAYFA